MRIFVHNFVADKAKIRRRAVARQGSLTQYAAKFAEKTYAYAYEDRFLLFIFGNEIFFGFCDLHIVGIQLLGCDELAVKCRKA